jgi:hypothetical protein
MLMASPIIYYILMLLLLNKLPPLLLLHRNTPKRDQQQNNNNDALRPSLRRWSRGPEVNGNVMVIATAAAEPPSQNDKLNNGNFAAWKQQQLEFLTSVFVSPPGPPLSSASESFVEAPQGGFSLGMFCLP